MTNHRMAVSSGLLGMMDRQEKARRQLSAIASVLGRANRILTGEPVSTVVSDESLAPGWTDGETIWLSGPMIRNKIVQSLDSKLILGLKGINYHELAHVLYTPRAKDEISVRILSDAHSTHNGSNLWYSFNILEDLRAEMLFVTEYPTATNYYVNTISQWIVDNPANELHDVWPLLSGRYYLPVELRKAARNAFAVKYGRDAADTVEDIAKKYLRLVYPKHTSKGYKLIHQLSNLLRDLVVNELKPPSGTHHERPILGRSDTSGMKGDSDQTWRQKEIADYRDDYLDELEKNSDEVLHPTDEDADEADNGDTSDSGSGVGDFNDDLEEDDQATANSGKGQTSSEDESSSNNESSDSAGADENGQGQESTKPNGGDDKSDSVSGSGASDGPGSPWDVRKDLLETAKTVVEKILNSQEMKEDLSAAQDSIRKELDREIKHVDGFSGVFSDIPASNDAQRTVGKIVRRLNDLRVDLEPVWIEQQPMGHLDVKSAMLAQPGDLDVFHVWEEGSEEEASTEAVILLDQSPSMRPMMEEASITMWTLKRALDEVGVTTTVLGYSDDWFVLYQPKDKAQHSKVRKFSVAGTSTVPTGALRQAEQILRGTRATNKLLISITDGEWVKSDAIRNSLGLIRRTQAHTIMVNIQNQYIRQSFKGRVEMDKDDVRLCYHEKGYYLGEIESIVPIVGDLVTELMREVSAANAARHV